MAEQIKSRGSNKFEGDKITLDDDNLAQVQRGMYRKPQFFGDMSLSSHNFDGFKTGVQTAATYIGFANSLVMSLVSSRESTDDQFYLTTGEYNQIQSLASSIASYGSVPYQTIVDFLVILCCIDNITDMTKIASVVEITELLNPNIIRQPFEILAIPTLYKIAFMANALDSIIRLYSRYANASTSAGQGGDDISSILSNLSSLIGGFGSSSAILTSMSSAENALGHFMSELLDGKRIPMTVIAKNPMKASPSYTGQTLFGESATSLSHVDVDEVFPKKIAVFPKPSNGAGSTSFGMMNFGSLGSTVMNLTEFASKMLFGSSSITSGSYKETAIINAVAQLSALTGATSTETFSVNSADVAIPLQIALSTIHAGTSSSPFSSSSFQEGWQLANHIANYMQNSNPSFLNVIKGLA